MASVENRFPPRSGALLRGCCLCAHPQSRHVHKPKFLQPFLALAASKKRNQFYRFVEIPLRKNLALAAQVLESMRAGCARRYHHLPDLDFRSQ